jgi:hypothetical protein
MAQTVTIRLSGSELETVVAWCNAQDLSIPQFNRFYKVLWRLRRAALKHRTKIVKGDARFKKRRSDVPPAQPSWPQSTA